MTPEALNLADAETMSDLRTYLSRARTVQDGQARLQVLGAALAVYVPVLAQEAIGTAVPTVLGLRVARLASPVADGFAAVYELGALADRLARAADGDTVLPLPPAEARAAWAGITPPLSGWEPLGEYDDDALRAEAETGMRAVTEALPPQAGRPVLDTVRGRIWSAPVQAGADGVELPLGAAFAAASLGFLRPGARSRVFGQGRWQRLTSTGGHTLVRHPAQLA
ncbi:hypothetical protein [Arthrobacter sp. JSM 101049]|uniref:hypothetical protein n=1 Tax=Arthrobacter sp. JSM 101049 TaxID=929097 RepID=UPI00356157E4